MSRMSGEEAKRYLADVPGEFVFWSHDGRIFKNITDLKNALENMSDENYFFHSGAERTDFSNWVNDIIGDEKLARDLKKCRDKNQAARTVTLRITFLESRI